MTLIFNGRLDLDSTQAGFFTEMELVCCVGAFYVFDSRKAFSVQSVCSVHLFRSDLIVIAVFVI